MDQKSGCAIEFTRNLNNVFSEFINENPEELKEELKEEGIDQDEIVSNGMELIRKLKIEQRKILASDKKTRLLNTIYLIQQNLKDITRENLINEINVSIPDAQNDVAVQTFFRALEEVNDEDIPEMLKQINIMKALTKTKGNNKK